MSSWERTFWAVFAANLVTAIGMMSFLPFFPSFLRELGLEDERDVARWTGLVFGAAPLAAAFMGPIWGSIGDRFGRKIMVIRALLAISFFVGVMGFAQTPLQLLCLRLGQGVFSGFVPPSITLVSVGAPKGVQGRVAGSLQASLAVGSILGPLAGALLGETLGLRSVFWFVSTASFLSALAVVFFATEDAALRHTLVRWSPTSVLASAWGDLRLLFSNVRLRAAVLLLFCVQFGLGATNPLMELFVEELWKGDPSLVPRLTGFLFTALAAAVLVATPLWGRYGDRVGHSRALRHATLSSGLSLLFLALASGYALLFAGRILQGFSLAGPNAAAFGVAAIETPAERRGSAFGAVFSARAFAVSIGAMSGGLLASVFGIRGLFFVVGTLVCVALVWAAVARDRRSSA